MAMAALAQATTDSNGIIVEKPEGTLYDNLYWNSEYYYSDGGYCTTGAEDGTVATIVEAVNEWEWWAPYATNIIIQGIFKNQTYEEALKTLGFEYVPKNRGRAE